MKAPCHTEVPTDGSALGLQPLDPDRMVGSTMESKSMSRTLTIPDHLYTRLAAEARSEGLASVEEWRKRHR